MKKGDKVRIKGTTRIGEIHTNGSFIWVKTESGDFFSLPPELVEPVEPVEPNEAEPTASQSFAVGDQVRVRDYLLTGIITSVHQDIVNGKPPAAVTFEADDRIKYVMPADMVEVVVAAKDRKTRNNFTVEQTGRAIEKIKLMIDDSTGLYGEDTLIRIKLRDLRRELMADLAAVK